MLTLKCHIRVKIERNFWFLALQNAFRKSRNYGVQNTIRNKLNSTRCVPPKQIRGQLYVRQSVFQETS